MTFEEWMINKGLSNLSARRYVRAVEGVLSEWTVENELITGTLISLTSQSNFDEVASKLRLLPIFQEYNERGNRMYSSALLQYSKYLGERHGSDVESDIDVILGNDDLSKTEKINLVKSRIGQGIFRQKLISYWKTCAATGFKDTTLLVASHIKPWRSSSNAERLDTFNGLLLTPNLDKVFDAGLVTFEPSGSIYFSPHLTEPDKFGINSEMWIPLSSKHEPFMDFHRTKVYRAK